MFLRNSRALSINFGLYGKWDVPKINPLDFRNSCEKSKFFFFTVCLWIDEFYLTRFRPPFEGGLRGVNTVKTLPNLVAELSLFIVCLRFQHHKLFLLARQSAAKFFTPHVPPHEGGLEGGNHYQNTTQPRGGLRFFLLFVCDSGTTSLFFLPDKSPQGFSPPYVPPHEGGIKGGSHCQITAQPRDGLRFFLLLVCDSGTTSLFFLPGKAPQSSSPPMSPLWGGIKGGNHYQNTTQPRGGLKRFQFRYFLINSFTHFLEISKNFFILKTNYVQVICFE